MPLNLPARFWWVSLATLLALALTASLGQWQLRRAAQKHALQMQMDERPQLPVLDNATVIASTDLADIQYRSAHLRGTWLPEQTVFLDNRQMDAKPGFYVITPLRLQGSAQAVVVQRGWVQRNFLDRSALPALPALAAGVVEVSGRIAPPPSKLYAFGGADVGTIRQNLDLAQYTQQVGVPLLPLSLQQMGPASDGVARDWPAVDTGISKHYGYAFQWFALCGLIAILYVWFQVVRRFHAPSR